MLAAKCKGAHDARVESLSPPLLLPFLHNIFMFAVIKTNKNKNRRARSIDRYRAPPPRARACAGRRRACAPACFHRALHSSLVALRSSTGGMQAPGGAVPNSLVCRIPSPFKLGKTATPRLFSFSLCTLVFFYLFYLWLCAVFCRPKTKRALPCEAAVMGCAPSRETGVANTTEPPPQRGCAVGGGCYPGLGCSGELGAQPPASYGDASSAVPLPEGQRMHSLCVDIVEQVSRSNGSSIRKCLLS